MIVALIIIAALACLIAGVFTGAAVLAWIALGLCVIGAAVLILPFALACLKSVAAEQTGDTGDTDVALEPDVTTETDDDARSGAEAATETSEGESPEDPAIEATKEGAPAAPETAKESAPAAAAPSTTVVLTIPGRRRYHMADCRLVAGHDDTEKLTLVEAQEEGFTRCTICSGEPASA